MNIIQLLLSGGSTQGMGVEGSGIQGSLVCCLDLRIVIRIGDRISVDCPGDHCGPGLFHLGDY